MNWYLNGGKCCRSSTSLWPNSSSKTGQCFFGNVRGSLKQIKDTRCTCDRLRYKWTSVYFQVVVELYNTIIARPFHTARLLARNLVSQIILFNSLHSVIWIPRQILCVQMLHPGDRQQRVDFYLINYCEDSRWYLHILWMDEAHFFLTGNLIPRSTLIELTKILTMLHQQHYTNLKGLYSATLQVHLFWVRSSPKRSLPQRAKRAPSQTKSQLYENIAELHNYRTAEATCR